MLGSFLIVASLSFTIPIIWKIFLDKKFYYIFYLLHIIFGQIFFLSFYISVIDFIGNVIFQRGFIGFSFFSFAVFLSFLLTDLNIQAKVGKLNIKHLLIKSVFLQIFIGGQILRWTNSKFFSNFVIEVFSAINIICLSFILYELLIKSKFKRIHLMTALCILAIVIGIVIGNLYYYKIFNSANLSPFYYSQFIFIAELVLFNGVLLELSFENERRQLIQINERNKEIIALERSALQAQMNPHFIFNSLNSIQNYIMRNDKDLAMDYLGRFARLIRHYLNASTVDLVTLEDEISMLENYLRLEQMRYSPSFEFHFDIEKTIDTTSVKLPPLLIQPFVENAVLHGMTARNTGGQISIGFTQHGNELHITVQDNGKGFRKDKPDALRKSLGMSITQKRLQYINAHAEGNYDIQTESNENGTLVNVFVKLT